MERSGAKLRPRITERRQRRKEMAERVAKLLGCEGSHEHKLESGEIYYMPCAQHPETI